MREPTFLILTALAGAPAHGYGIIQTVAELSEGRVTLRAGTLYAALDRLASEGSVKVDNEQVVNGRNRRYYSVTTAGRDRLVAEIVRMESNALAAREQLELAHGVR